MKKIILIAALLTCACVRLPHVIPAPRNADVARRAIARVYVTCSDVDMLSPEYNSDIPGVRATAPSIEWAPPAAGTGVVISERHVLTAAHVVRCPVIPSVTVLLSDGRIVPMEVERDDAMFGGGQDVARLEVTSAENLGMYIAPPALAPDGTAWVHGYDEWCAETTHGRSCGSPGDASEHSAEFEATTRKGDSGSGVYDLRGRLVGLVSSGNGVSTTLVRVGAYWLEGT